MYGDHETANKFLFKSFCLIIASLLLEVAFKNMVFESSCGFKHEFMNGDSVYFH